MFNRLVILDFKPLHAGGSEARLALPDGSTDEGDPFAQMAQAEAADASLLRLVLCAAGATLVLALGLSLV